MSAEAGSDGPRDPQRPRARDTGAQPGARGGSGGAGRAVLRHRGRPAGWGLAEMAGPTRARRNATTVVLLAAVVCGMVGLSFASVPLYRLFCQATGFGGTTQRAAAAPEQIAETVVTVRFDAETSPDLAWEFRPLEAAVQVHPGEQREV